MWSLETRCGDLKTDLPAILGGDFNLDGGVDAIDLNTIWRPNNGIGTQVPTTVARPTLKARTIRK